MSKNREKTVENIEKLEKISKNHEETKRDIKNR